MEMTSWASMPREWGSRPRAEQARIEKGWPRKKLEKRLTKSEKQRVKKTRDGKVQIEKERSD